MAKSLSEEILLRPTVSRKRPRLSSEWYVHIQR